MYVKISEEGDNKKEIAAKIIQGQKHTLISNYLS